jgi:putative ABC transport system substrate-binding protein
MYCPELSDYRGAALRNRLPSIGAKEYGEAGGPVGYGENILALYRRAAYFVDRILKGAKPADLPDRQGLDLVINLKTARALGIEVLPAPRFEV